MCIHYLRLCFFFALANFILFGQQMGICTCLRVFNKYLAVSARAYVCVYSLNSDVFLSEFYIYIARSVTIFHFM